MITYDKVPIEQVNVDKLRTLLASPEFALLKAVIGAKASERTVQFANASLYRKVRKEGSMVQVPDDAADLHAENSRARAAQYTAALDVLDEIESNPEWFNIKLDQRR